MRRGICRNPGPALSWVAAFVGCVTLDAALGRWLLLPIFVASFYSGVVAIELLTYPLLGWWRERLRSRGPRAWYFAVTGVLWAGPAVALASLAPVWLGWGWERALPLQAAGVLLLAPSVGFGAWAMAHMGWTRLLLAPDLFPTGIEARNRLPRRLVVAGPYRHVRHPLYGADLGVILGTALLTQKWVLIALAGVYPIVLGVQLRLEERELETRFGETHARYRRRVPGLMPRPRPVDPGEILDSPSGQRTDRKRHPGRRS